MTEILKSPILHDAPLGMSSVEFPWLGMRFI